MNYIREIGRIGAPYDAIHIVTDPWIEFTGDSTARARWYLLDHLTRQAPVTKLYTIGGHFEPLLHLAIYEDECRHENGRWLIARTKLNFLWPERLMPTTTT